MNLDKMDQVSGVMRAKYDKEYRAISAILAEETKLREKLNRLDDQIARNQDLCISNHSMKMVGAQILWLGWTGKTRHQINIELAQVMSKKLMTMHKVRAAFGRQRAVEMMISVEQKNLKRQHARKQGDILLSIG